MDDLQAQLRAGRIPESSRSVPNYNPARQIPPDLLAKSVGGNPQSAASIAYGETAGSINARVQPEYFKALRRQGYFVTQPFVAGTTVIKIRPFESRTYFFIQNLSTAGDLYVGFGTEPNSEFGLTLVAGAAYEPFTVPTNEIYLLAQNPDTTGFIIYSRESD